MKLGLKLIMCWMLAIAFGGAAAGTMIASNSGMAHQLQVAAVQ